MKKIVVNLVTLFILVSCIKQKNNILSDSTVILNNIKVLEIAEVDSLIQDKIFNLRLKTIKAYSQKYIIEKASAFNKMTTEKFIYKYVDSKINSVTNSDVEYFKSENNQYDKPDSIIKKHIYIKTKMLIQDKLLDSLKKVMNYRITLLPKNLRTVNIKTLPFFYINKVENPETIVYIISDYNCSTCKANEEKTNQIIEKYKNKVEFRYVYFGSYINPKLYYLSYKSSNKMGFCEMKQQIFNYSEFLENNDTILSIFEKYNYNIDNDVMEKSNLQLLQTKNILTKNNIYSTPTYIVNSLVLDFDYSIDVLEELIIRQMKK